ncbi:tetratricopeptide (TPR) repeat protein [Salinibacter ruber]|uniref:CsgG/HfaB family protein n=1 Tax=Salinibacter ruber TaxID=146919 RepID=UPI00161E2183|nr:tetratricopeptide repeat protein [Salinibacter ruber]MBB4070237.1 tetratricopeptide (TPR) repeat protein [Salinibacter ruber]
MSLVGRVLSIPFFALSVVVIGMAACAPEPQLREDPEDFREEVARLQREIAENPEEAAPLRDLGAIYVRTKRPAEGYRYLEKALSRGPNDPKTLFYLGVASERLGRTEEAQRLYRRFPKVPEDSQFRALMRGRYQWLLRQEVQAQMAQMVQREDTLASDMSSRTVAVLPLSYQGGSDEYAPLGRGLAEMVSVDLAQINELQLVERVRIEALLDELELAESQYVDPKTAPRTGRILGASRVIGGAYSVLDGEKLRVETALAEVQEDVSSEVETHADALDRLFELEKEIVFGVVDRLGVDLSAQERKQIERVPTRNLQAFLAYSRGLQEEALGNYEAAANSFRRAQELDPEFSMAAEKQEAMGDLSAVAGGTDQALLAAGRIALPSSTISLMQNRLLMQSLSLGMPLSQGRQPAAESNSRERPFVLQDPPPPPEEGGSP